MSNLTDKFIDWMLSEYGIHLKAVPDPNGDSFEKIFPDLYHILKEEGEQE